MCIYSKQEHFCVRKKIHSTSRNIFDFCSLYHSQIMQKSPCIFCFQFPSLDGRALKMSGIGKAVMYLCRHPKETRQNKKLAGKLISKYGIPVPNLALWSRMRSLVNRGWKRGVRLGRDSKAFSTAPVRDTKAPELLRFRPVAFYEQRLVVEKKRAP